jgi:hypothetical protein
MIIITMKIGNNVESIKIKSELPWHLQLLIMPPLQSYQSHTYRVLKFKEKIVNILKKGQRGKEGRDQTRLKSIIGFHSDVSECGKVWYIAGSS